MDHCRRAVVVALADWRVIGWLGFIAVALLIASCSFRFFYRQLDWFIPWRLGEYVTLDNGQRSLLEQHLLEQLDWHCSSQLEAYASWFRELQQEPQPFSRDDIDQIYRRGAEFWDVLMQQISPDVAALLRSASEQQIEELFDNLEKRNQELDKEYVSASWRKVQRRRSERVKEFLSRWLGPLEPEQQKAIAIWAKELGRNGGKEWITSRRHWQAALQEALKLRGHPKRFEARIRVLLVKPESLWPESYKRDYAIMRERTLAMLAEVASLQTSEQTRHLRHELVAWANDFDKLSCTTSPDTGRAAGKRQ